MQCQRAARRLSRRAVLMGLGAASSALLAACGGGKTAITSTAKPDTGAPAPSASSPITTVTGASTIAAAPTVGGAAATIDYWFWADDPSQATLYTGTIDKFQQQNPRIKVKVDQIATVADARKKLITANAAGAGMPDCSFGSAGWLAEFNDAKMILPLDDYFKSWSVAPDLLPSIMPLLHGSRPTDPIGLVPLDTTVPYLYYRADWLAEAGLQPPDTLEEIGTVAKALTNAPDRYGYGFRGGDNGGFTQQLAPFLKGNGVKIVKEDGTVDLDSPAAIDTVAWYVGLVTKEKVAQPSAATDRFPELFAQFQGGKLGLLTHGLWSWKTQADVLGDKISAVQAPRGAVRRWTSVGVEGTIVYNASKHKDEAWQLAAFFGAPEQVRLWTTGRGSGPLLKSQSGDKIFTESRFYKAALASQSAWGQYPDYLPNWPKMNDRYAPEIQRLLKGDTTPAQFCKTLADVLRKG